MNDFTPPWPLRNPHLMTIASAFWRRRYPRLPPSVPRLFETEPGTEVRGDCHWQENPREHPTLILLHGLEGSSASSYILGAAEKAWVAGFNAVRLNQRNCGGTEALSPSLYHSGLSCDIRAVALELIGRDALPAVFAAGFSMGGNLVLKMASEFGGSAPRALCGFAAVAPVLDLAACVDALVSPRNFLYNRRFVRGLKRRMLCKSKLFPEIYSADALARDMKQIRTVRDFDDRITARFCGFRDAADYYARMSAGPLVGAIRRPTLILAAQDDPFVPFSIFDNAALRENPRITLLAPRHGGHCAFISREKGDARFWAEARLVDFCAEVLANSRGK
ncbi:MAG: alpha/beta fold hydrolase [Candidatus Acidiferrales bacterium]